MKYIMIERTYMGCEQKIPIIFPNYLVHSEVAKAIEGMLVTIHNDKNLKVVSAGEVIVDVTVDLQSRSYTLKMIPQQGDQDVINSHDYFSGLS